jgi:hypothetical protein
MTLISADSLLVGPNAISFYPPSYHPRFQFLTDSYFKPGFYIFVFYTRDVQSLYRKGPETSLWALSRGVRLKMTNYLPKCLYYCVILIIYICIYLIYKYNRRSHKTVWWAATWTAIRYIIETRCEILVTLRHKLLLLITLLTFPLEFSTV